MEFQNKTTVITGASAGIGKAIAFKLASLGCNLVLIARNKERLENLKKELESTSVRVEIYSCDVSSSKQVKETFNRIKDKFHQINFLVNNAGVNSVKTMEKLTEQDVNQEIDVSVKGTFYCTIHAYSLMKHGGVIINMGSIRGRMGTISTSIPYAAAKAGVMNLTKSFATQLAKYNIRVNSVSPGPVYPTEMNRHWDEEKKKKVAEDTLLKRIPTPEDIANVVYFLLSDMSNCITGQSLDINSGMYMS